MAALILPSRWTRQPQYPTLVDIRNSSSSGLRIAINGGIRYAGINLAGYPNPTLTGAFALSNTRHVNYEGASGVNIAFTASQYPSLTTSVNGLSGIAVVRSSAASPYFNGENRQLFDNYNGSGGWHWDISAAIGGGSGTVVRQSFTIYGVAGYDQTNYTIDSQADEVIGFTWAPSTWKVWQNGSLRDAITTGSSIAASSATAYAIKDYIGRFSLLLLWDRALSDGEISALTSNPWQIFRRLTHRIYFGTASATGTTITPSAGTLTLSGTTPQIIVPTTITPTVGSLSFTGRTPSLDRGITPAVGSLTFTGRTPSIDFGIRPAVGSLTFTGQTPVITVSGAASITPSTGTLTFTGRTPSLDLGIRPTVGTLTIGGTTPTASIDTGRTPGAGSLTFGGIQPTLSLGTILTPSVGTLTFTGLTPVLTTSAAAITPDTGSLGLTGYQPIVVDSTPVSTSETFSGGYPVRRYKGRRFGEYRIQTPEEIQAEREKFGVLPKKAKKAIQKIAERELDSAAADKEALRQAYAEFSSGDIQARAEEALRQELKQDKQRYEARFVPILEAILAEGLMRRAQAQIQAEQMAIEHERQMELAKAIADQQEEEDVRQILALWLEM